MKVAIMQPYFFPYLGYFRLAAMADLFIILDCVQFPRRGYVHRCRTNRDNKEYWLTLPIKKEQRSTLIKDLQFIENAQTEIKNRIALYENKLSTRIDCKMWLNDEIKTPLDLIVNSLNHSHQALNISTKILRSSQIKINRNLKAENKIIALCKTVEATEYINLPGGKTLYTNDNFIKEGIKLSILSDYQGDYNSILYRLNNESRQQLIEELNQNLESQHEIRRTA